MYFTAVDGDNIGRIIEKYIIENDEQKLRAFSEYVENYFSNLSLKLKDLGGDIIFCAGDNLLCKFHNKLQESLKKIIKPENSFTISIGIGKTLIETFLALKYAKANGKNQIISYEKIKK